MKSFCLNAVVTMLVMFLFESTLARAQAQVQPGAPKLSFTSASGQPLNNQQLSANTFVNFELDLGDNLGNGDHWQSNTWVLKVVDPT